MTPVSAKRHQPLRPYQVVCPNNHHHHHHNNNNNKKNKKKNSHISGHVDQQKYPVDHHRGLWSTNGTFIRWDGHTSEGLGKKMLWSTRGVDWLVT